MHMSEFELIVGGGEFCRSQICSLTDLHQLHKHAVWQSSDARRRVQGKMLRKTKAASLYLWTTMIQPHKLAQQQKQTKIKR
jgi:hypothetical protein